MWEKSVCHDLMNPNLISALAIFSVALKMRLHVVFRPVAAQRVGRSRRRQVEYVANLGDLFQVVHAEYMQKLPMENILKADTHSNKKLQMFLKEKSAILYSFSAFNKTLQHLGSFFFFLFYFFAN